ncbi:MAG: hypothetical protein LN569_01760, partial [Rickettsia endosymbiont of Labidopullus appendiculatus]|nr:hypothetical protein [Rickettsia endosymbiont of Labidopullus appendiculatus]
ISILLYLSYIPFCIFLSCYGTYHVYIETVILLQLKICYFNLIYNYFFRSLSEDIKYYILNLLTQNYRKLCLIKLITRVGYLLLLLSLQTSSYTDYLSRWS